MKSKIKTLTLLVLVSFFLFSNILNNFIIKEQSLELNEKNQIQIKLSGFWNLTGSPIFIDDSDINYNWSKTAFENDWCSGSGNWTDPYIIENVTINGQSSGNCLEIKNSDAYFIIRNCSLYNSGSSSVNAGIYLFYVNNGKIINNNCSDNIGNGISLWYSDNNTLSGNTANNNFDGISLSFSDRNSIFGNNASYNTGYGIHFVYSNNNKLSGNTANKNYFGISLGDYSSNNTLSGNTIDNNIFGISLYNSNNNTLSGNFMNFCGIQLLGSLGGMASHSIDDTNLVNNNPVYYYVNETGLGSSNFTDAGQIILINCSNSIISGLNLSNSTTGIYLGYSDNNSISGNTASNNNFHGIMLWNSDNNSISGNTASNNSYYGICLDGSNNNTLSGNTASNNRYYGICLFENNNNNTLSGNTVSNNRYYGIYLFDNNNNNTLSGNTADNNTYGIVLDHSSNNTLSGNLMNFCGIYLSGSLAELASHIIDDTNLVNNKPIYYYVNEIGLGSSNFTDAGQIILINCNKSLITGLILSFGYIGIDLRYSNNNMLSGNTIKNRLILDSNSNNNKIFLNNFVNNGINTEDNGNNNTWDDGFIGNYWDDYAGVDANDDGIGDTPYIVPGTAGSQDNFPIWTDGDDIAPVITVILPLPDSIFGLDAPNYNISIDELNLDTIWYTLDGGGTNYTITALTGTFNQTAWQALSEGSLTIRFYANDTAGNIGFIDVEVIIEIPEDLPIISFGNYYILFTFITILSFIILKKRKKK